MPRFNFCEPADRKYAHSLLPEVRDIDLEPLYKYLCPILIFICFISITFNAMLIGISRQSKSIHKSPIVLLSLNLALTDLIAAFFNGLGILLNSYLPEVFNIRISQCLMLKFEVVRCTAFVASALHLLALAFVHYRGIVKPLHYRSQIFNSGHLSRTVNFISIACWIFPSIIIIYWFRYSPCQGFQSENCDTLFLLSFSFRYMILTLFALPLLLMSFMYLRIFIIISRLQKNKVLNHEKSTLSKGFIMAAGGTVGTGASVNLPELVATTNSNKSLKLAEDSGALDENKPAKCSTCLRQVRATDEARKSGYREQDDDDDDDNNNRPMIISMDYLEQTSDKRSGKLIDQSRESIESDNLLGDSSKSISNGEAKESSRAPAKVWSGPVESNGGERTLETEEPINEDDAGKFCTCDRATSEGKKRSLQAIEDIEETLVIETSGGSLARGQQTGSRARQNLVSVSLGSERQLNSISLALKPTLAPETSEQVQNSPSSNSAASQTFQGVQAGSGAAESRQPNHVNQWLQKQRAGRQKASQSRDAFRSSSRYSTSNSMSASTYEPSRKNFHVAAVPQSNTKAAITTLLILGTYFLSYIPTILLMVLTCIDFCPYPLYQLSSGKRIFFGALTNLLLIAKSIIDPFVYSHRMSEIQQAVNRYVSKNLRSKKTRNLQSSSTTNTQRSTNISINNFSQANINSTNNNNQNSNSNSNSNFLASLNNSGTNFDSPTPKLPAPLASSSGGANSILRQALTNSLSSPGTPAKQSLLDQASCQAPQAQGSPEGAEREQVGGKIDSGRHPIVCPATGGRLEVFAQIKSLEDGQLGPVVLVGNSIASEQSVIRCNGDSNNSIVKFKCDLPRNEAELLVKPNKN